MKTLYDGFGRPILLSEKPALSIREGRHAVLEGVFEVTHYNDVCEVDGKCIHCGSKVTQILRIPKHIQDRPEMRPAIAQTTIDCAQRNHVCPMIHDGKTLIEDWYKAMDVPYHNA